MSAYLLNFRNYEIEAFPIKYNVGNEDGYFIIESETLGIVGAGNSFEEAEKSFFEDFDYIQKSYNQLPEKELSLRVKSIKRILNSIIVV